MPHNEDSGPPARGLGDELAAARSAVIDRARQRLPEQIVALHFDRHPGPDRAIFFETFDHDGSHLHELRSGPFERAATEAFLAIRSFEPLAAASDVDASGRVVMTLTPTEERA